MATPRPNHTQIPNDLLGNIERGNIVEPGLMAKLEGSQLKVYLAVCRMTIGYHQESRRASFSMIETFTGLSRPAVNSAAKALEEMNLIERTKDGGVTLWQLAVNSVNQDEVVNSVNQQDDYGQAAVNSVNQLVNSVNQTSKLSLPPSKKETKKKPKKETVGDKSPLPPANDFFDEKGNPTSRHPAIVVFRTEMHRYPRKNQYQDIAKRVGVKTADVAFWQQVVNRWKLTPYAPTNIEGMLDCYERRELPTTKPNGANYGQGRNHQSQPKPTEPEAGTWAARRAAKLKAAGTT